MLGRRVKTYPGVKRERNHNRIRQRTTLTPSKSCKNRGMKLNSTVSESAPIEQILDLLHHRLHLGCPRSYFCVKSFMSRLYFGAFIHSWRRKECSRKMDTLTSCKSELSLERTILSIRPAAFTKWLISEMILFSPKISSHFLLKSLKKPSTEIWQRVLCRHKWNIGWNWRRH